MGRAREEACTRRRQALSMFSILRRFKIGMWQRPVRVRKRNQLERQRKRSHMAEAGCTYYF